MSQPRLENLVQELKQLGYSRRYIRRLTQELIDHFYCVLDATGCRRRATDELNKLFDQTVGTTEVLSSAVSDQPDLMPWTKRNPQISFLMLPGLVIAVFSTLMIWIGHAWQQEIVNPENQGLRLLINWSHPSLLAVVAGIGAWLTLSYRVNWTFQGFTVGLAAFSSCFATEAVKCRLTGQMQIFSLWSFNPISFLMPFIATTFVVLCYIVWRGINTTSVPLSKAELPRFGWSAINLTGLWRVALCSVSSLVFCIVFCFAVETTQNQLRKLPLHKMVEEYNSARSRAIRILMAAQRPGTKQKLKLNEEQLNAWESVLSEYQHAIESRQQRPVRVAASSPGLPVKHTLAYQTFAAQICKILNASQKTSLKSIEYRNEGIKTLFLKEIREKLGVDRSQFKMICERYKANMETEKAWLRKWRAANKEEKKQIAILIQQEHKQFEQQLLNLLTEAQRKQFISITS